MFSCLFVPLSFRSLILVVGLVIRNSSSLVLWIRLTCIFVLSVWVPPLGFTFPILTPRYAAATYRSRVYKSAFSHRPEGRSSLKVWQHSSYVSGLWCSGVRVACKLSLESRSNHRNHRSNRTKPWCDGVTASRAVLVRFSFSWTFLYASCIAPICPSRKGGDSCSIDCGSFASVLVSGFAYARESYRTPITALPAAAQPRADSGKVKISYATRSFTKNQKRREKIKTFIQKSRAKNGDAWSSDCFHHQNCSSLR